MPSKYVTSSDGSKIYAEAIGDPTKPALVLVPGYTLTTMVFDKQFEDKELQKELYLIRYDMRGHGQSAMPETPEGHLSELYADDFKAVCEAFNVTKPVFGGWSLGGCIAADICTHLGSDYISGVIYLAGMHILSEEAMAKLPSPEVVAALGGALNLEDVALYKRSILEFGNLVFYDPPSIPFDTRMAWAGVALCQPPIVSTLVLSRKQSPEKLFEAGKKGLRVLCIHGKYDGHRTSGMAVVELLKPHFGDSLQVVELDNAGHAFFFEKPEETNRALLAFVKKVAA